MHYTRVLDVDPKNIEAIGNGMIYHRLELMMRLGT